MIRAAWILALLAVAPQADPPLDRLLAKMDEAAAKARGSTFEMTCATGGNLYQLSGIPEPRVEAAVANDGSVRLKTVSTASDAAVVALGWPTSPDREEFLSADGFHLIE